MATAGYLNTISASPDGTTWTVVNGLNSATFSPKDDVLDQTAFSGGSTAKSKFLGLEDGQVQLSGDFLPTDAGQLIIRNARKNRSACYIKALFDGTHGYSVQGIAPSYNVKSAVAGKAEFDVTVEFNGSPTDI